MSDKQNSLLRPQQRSGKVQGWWKVWKTGGATIPDNPKKGRADGAIIGISILKWQKLVVL